MGVVFAQNVVAVQEEQAGRIRQADQKVPCLYPSDLNGEADSLDIPVSSSEVRENVGGLVSRGIVQHKNLVEVVGDGFETVADGVSVVVDRDERRQLVAFGCHWSSSLTK